MEKDDSMRTRLMLPSDLHSVVAIEKRSFRAPWTRDDFSYQANRRDNLGMVIEIDGEVRGYMVYKMDENWFKILNLAVDERSQRMGIGSKFVNFLIGRLAYGRRTRTLVGISELNLDGQLFYRSLGFRWIETFASPYLSSDEDEYLLAFVHVPSVGELAESLEWDG